jgi:hypothetical protein
LSIPSERPSETSADRGNGREKSNKNGTDLYDKIFNQNHVKIVKGVEEATQEDESEAN